MTRLILALVSLLVVVGTSGVAGAAVVTEEFTVSSSQGGITLYLRNKHSDSLYDVKPERIVLFLHGASYPAHVSFDFPVDGKSWMDWMAERGFDVYSLDIRGYGKSGRPGEMKQTPESNPPLADTQAAVDDVERAVEFILSRRNAPRMVLAGWSWGATVAGVYATTAASGRIERLVLYAPQWVRDTQPPTEAEIARVPAWRSVDPRNARDAWLKAVPEAKRETILPKAVFNAWMNAAAASDPEPAIPGTVRAPNGVVADTMKYWASGKPRWNPAKVTVPTLVVQGEWDAEAPPAMGMVVFNQLTHSPGKRYVMVGEATHAALIEANRRDLYRVVQEFLSADGR